MTPVDDIDSALRYIPADERETWVRVGMAIKSELGDSGYSLWDYWSQSASNYQERAAQLVWRSFRSGRTTIATRNARRLVDRHIDGAACHSK